MADPCCSGDVGFLLFQINVICLLTAAIGTAVIMQHPAWFGEVPIVAQLLGR